jgi:hypothetical protein
MILVSPQQLIDERLYSTSPLHWLASGSSKSQSAPIGFARSAPVPHRLGVGQIDGHGDVLGMASARGPGTIGAQLSLTTY